MRFTLPPRRITLSTIHLSFLRPALLSFALLSLIFALPQRATGDDGSKGQAQATVDYERDVKPLLRERCSSCHGGLNQESELRVDTAASLLEGGYSGPAIVPGEPESSLLLERVTAEDEGERMPPEGRALFEEEIALLRVWIEQGAPAPENEQPEGDAHSHWAFQPLRRPVLPLDLTGPAAGGADEDTTPSSSDQAPDRDGQTVSPPHPVDAFIEAEIHRRGMVAHPPADKPQLLRRVYLDLIGIPPTVEQLREFLADDSADAYDRVVERLLESPQYGERWGRHWMDVWRYSDWYGRRMVPDVWNSAPQIWRWRDWIVQSLNEDKGYDRMIQEMLAADEMYPEDVESAVATGYLIRNWYALNPNDWMRSNVEHSAKAFLGLTFNCAHCHDHKYDPIRQDDYFHLRAFFEPIGIRQDRVAGETDPGPFQDYEYGVLRKIVRLGSVSVFDQKPEAPTWFYHAGDERNRVSERGSIDPQFPEFFGDLSITVEPVELPPTTWYPGLRPTIRDTILAEQQEAEAQSQTELETIRHRVDEALPALQEALAEAQTRYDQYIELAEQEVQDLTTQVAVARQAVRLEEQKLEVAEAKWHAAQVQTKSVIARLAADARRYLPHSGSHVQASAEAEAISQVKVDAASQVAAQVELDADVNSTGESNAEVAELIRQASQLERDAAVAAARAEVLQQELRLLTAQAKPEEADNRQAEIDAATTQLAAARQQAEQAQTERDDSSRDDDYSPFSPMYPKSSTGRRRALAQWITHPENPLTARVAVNHIWLRHFHAPLVADVANFGRSGEVPTHPELLDWLAAELMESGWSMKRIHQLIVTSQAYRRSSRVHLEPESLRSFSGVDGKVVTDGEGEWLESPNQSIDPENRYLWRMNTGRMEAEVIRDSLLATADSLDLTMGGQELENSEALTSPRRTLYFSCNPELDGKSQFGALFDAPSPVECYRRTESIIPQQALALTNSELIHRLSHRVAEALWQQLEPAERAQPRAFVSAAYERILTRAPTADELEICLAFLDSVPHSTSTQSLDGQEVNVAVEVAESEPESARDAASNPSADPEVGRRASLVRALFNHNDFVTIR
jgi:mono/diheme cytochrome c family protein